MAEARRKRGRPHGWLIAVVAVYVVTVIALPLGALFAGAAEDLGATLANLRRPEALGALGRTIALASAALVINVVFGVAAALVLVRDRFFGRRLVGWIIEMPLAMSPVMIGVAFFVLYGRTGWLQPVIEPLGIDVVFAFPGMLLVTVFVTLPFVARETQLLLQELGSSEDEAAATLGANRWQTFWLITLPNILPGIASGAALVVARALGEFGAVLVIGGAVSGRTDTATTFVYHAVEERQSAAAHGISIVLVALSLAALATFAIIQGRSRR